MDWNRMSRRGVLTGAGAGIVAGSTLSQTALSEPRARPDGRKLGYAVVGLGSYATRQIMPRIAQCEHAKLVALVSGTPAKLEQYGAEYGIPKTHRYSYADYDRIRDNPDIDLVYVVLPVFLHAEYTIRAFQAGKHVLCEKPMAMNSAECEAMIAAGRKAKRKLMIGYRCHFEQYNLHVRKLIAEGAIGKLTAISAESGFYAQPGQWRLEKDKAGGGSLFDIGIYSIQAARYLAGEEPEWVSAVESTDRSDPRFATVEDRVAFSFRFPSGVVANCLSSYSSGHNHYRATGRDGYLDMEPATAYEGNRLFKGRAYAGSEAVVLPPPAKLQWVGQMDHLAECAMRGAEPIVGGEEGLRDIRLIEAILQSAREGRAIRTAGA
ncbi:Gfo/Idh/MocA family oxidoreductase [Sphingomonas canadensis]|nr:Gfo/Idh/MocA family oxidoreductase [Sphingomonas canadensis]MCW3836464.1 Gfo/Idh/MocA family oxidoreductase [Sphingomonas canadensis]